MKFNENLTELRKKAGLSQEELGYKLNVTRQTISKWELGQTTPEMDKLSDISNFFGVSVDTLLNETEEVKIKDKKITNDKQKDKRIVLIILGVLVVLIILGVATYGSVISIFKGIFNLGQEGQEGALKVIEKVVSVAEQQIDEQDKTEEQTSEIYNQVLQQIKEKQGQNNEEEFNQKTEQIINSSEREYLTSVLEMYSGTKQGVTVKTVIDKIVTNNKKYINQIIIVKYQEQSITDSEELQKLKAKLDKNTEYEISYEYDENGCIYQMDILDLN